MAIAMSRLGFVFIGSSIFARSNLRAGSVARRSGEGATP